MEYNIDKFIISDDEGLRTYRMYDGIKVEVPHYEVINTFEHYSSPGITGHKIIALNHYDEKTILMAQSGSSDGYYKIYSYLVFNQGRFIGSLSPISEFTDVSVSLFGKHFITFFNTESPIYTPYFTVEDLLAIYRNPRVTSFQITRHKIEKALISNGMSWIDFLTKLKLSEYSYLLFTIACVNSNIHVLAYDFVGNLMWYILDEPSFEKGDITIKSKEVSKNGRFWYDLLFDSKWATGSGSIYRIARIFKVPNIGDIIIEALEEKNMKRMLSYIQKQIEENESLGTVLNSKFFYYKNSIINSFEDLQILTFVSFKNYKSLTLDNTILYKKNNNFFALLFEPYENKVKITVTSPLKEEEFVEYLSSQQLNEIDTYKTFYIPASAGVSAVTSYSSYIFLINNILNVIGELQHERIQNREMDIQR
ncbi:MAG: hypothetical protein QXP36_00435 [Conexivisphaerales archaeon]